MLQIPTAVRQCYAFLFGRPLLVVLLALVLVASAAAAVATLRLDFRCACEDAVHGQGGGEGTLITVEALAQCQKVSDLLIATAYFSIPLELLYFAFCSRNFPSRFKRVLVHFGAFIVPCGLTHLLAALSIQHAPHGHPPPLLLGLTLAASKLLTAVVSLATAVSQLTLLPQLLRAKTREDLLRRKALELRKEVGAMRQREHAGWEVEVLVRAVRASLDRHAVLSATVSELTKALGLSNCAVWMPVDKGGEVCFTLVQESLIRRKQRGVHGKLLCIPVDDPEVAEISATGGAKRLPPGSQLAQLSSWGGGVVEESGAAAATAVRVLLHDAPCSNPTTEGSVYYQDGAMRCAILVCVLPLLEEDEDGVDWGDHELEVLQLVSDEVSVALSQAAALEEIQLERARLAETNEVIDLATAHAVAANAAGASFLAGLLKEMRVPVQSTVNLVDALAWQPDLGSDKKLAIDALSTAGALLSSLVDGFAAEHTEAVGGSGFYTLEARPFRLVPMTKAVAGIAKALCLIRHFPFVAHVDESLSDLTVVGDEMRVVQVIMHVLDTLLEGADDGGHLTFRVRSDWNVEGTPERRWAPWRMTSFPDGHVNVEFKFAIRRCGSGASSASSSQIDWTSEGDGVGMMDSTICKCKRLVQMMQGNMWIIPHSQTCSNTAILLIPFHLPPQTPDAPLQKQPTASCDGLRVLLADGQSVSRATTRLLLQSLGCRVSPATSEFQCLGYLRRSRPPPFDIVVLDIDMPHADMFAVSAQIHKCRSAPWPLVLALVGHGREAVWDRCLQAGMVGMIRKPVTRRGIADELSRVLRMMT